ncbi:hypothetical protein DPMN_100128 [Dreissena polymorpha]|uniref:Uncharacterized protein n=1 Tax=Dreissena polymorpha TaxID=45954 RepID=A0A9D4R761_DREPO|nr:hypothetical protein DPMN_100128 [Dreissena polymorpha]
MYGGHIADDWDRNLCRTYLQVYMHSDMLSLLWLCYMYLYGLHPNAEIEKLNSCACPTEQANLRRNFQLKLDTCLKILPVNEKYFKSEKVSPISLCGMQILVWDDTFRRCINP